MEQRFDSIPLSDTYFTPEGYLIDNPILTRVGIFEYHNPDGTIRRELRLPEEVFAAESLASYKGKPVNLTHEAGHVDVEQQLDVELGVQQLERLHAVVGIEVFVAAAEDFGKDLLVHFRIARDQDLGFDHSVDLIRILGRALL